MRAGSWKQGKQCAAGRVSKEFSCPLGKSSSDQDEKTGTVVGKAVRLTGSPRPTPSSDKVDWNCTMHFNRQKEGRLAHVCDPNTPRDRKQTPPDLQRPHKPGTKDKRAPDGKETGCDAKNVWRGPAHQQGWLGQHVSFAASSWQAACGAVCMFGNEPGFEPELNVQCADTPNGARHTTVQCGAMQQTRLSVVGKNLVFAQKKVRELTGALQALFGRKSRV